MAVKEKSQKVEKEELKRSREFIVSRYLRLVENHSISTKDVFYSKRLKRIVTVTIIQTIPLRYLFKIYSDDGVLLDSFVHKVE